MTLEDGRNWWDRVPDMAKNITYVGSAVALFASAWLWLGLPIVAFRSDVAQATEDAKKFATKTVNAHANDDLKMFASLKDAAEIAKKTADIATERAVASLLQNSYTRRDLLRAEDYKIKSNKVPPATDEEARILSIHTQQVRDSLRQVSRDICQLTNQQECDRSP